MDIVNPVRKTHAQKVSRPLPRHLKDEQVESFFQAIKGPRDRAMFMLMLRCGLRVEEVAHLSLGVLDFKHRKLLIEDGKGGKDRIVYLSHDAHQGLMAYLRVRPSSRSRRIFLVQKGPRTAQPISIRGIQKRMEFYARKTKLRVSCHHLLGHSNVKTTQRYCRVSNLKVHKDYFNAMEVIMRQRVGNPDST